MLSLFLVKTFLIVLDCSVEKMSIVSIRYINYNFTLTYTGLCWNSFKIFMHNKSCVVTVLRGSGICTLINIYRDFLE
jgi:hypothetical protein